MTTEQIPTLEEALIAELNKDVKLKGGGTAIDPDTGQPLKVTQAIAMSVTQLAMKGEISSVSFIRNLTRQSDPEATAQRKQQAEALLRETTDRLRRELEADGLWCGQDVELEQLAQNHVIIDRLNQLMQADDYEDIITELKKDGTVSTHINPLIAIRDRAQKQFLQDWKQLRLEALQRIALQRQNAKARK